MEIHSLTDALTCDWALCLDAETHDLTGIAVRHAEDAGYSVVNVGVNGRDIAVCDARHFSDRIVCVPLPPCPSRTMLVISLAYVSLGAKEHVLNDFLRPVVSGEDNFADQWRLLFFVQAFGVEWKGARTRIIELLATDPAMSASGDALNARILTAVLNLWKPRIDPLGLLAKERPFSSRPTASDFEINVKISVAPRDRTVVRPYRHSDKGGVLGLLRKHIERDKNGQPTPRSSFDDHDLKEAEEELHLAKGGDQLNGPVLTGGGHLYAAAEYWVATQESAHGEMVSGCVGLLTFYGAVNEPWIGYLCKNGALLTEVILRRARDRGFGNVFVWTTPGNQGAIQFYKNTSFEPSPRPPRELAASNINFMAFQHHAMPPTLQEFYSPKNDRPASE